MRNRLLATLYRFMYPVARLWWAVRAPVRIGVRGIVLDQQGRVLLVRHSYGSEGWGFPGGGPGRRERLADTIVREVREETGVHCQVEKLQGVYDSFAEGKSDHVAFFVCRAVDSAPPRPGSPEIVSCGFFAVDDLPAQASQGTRRRLAEMQAGNGAHWGLW
ncbi:MAG: NUDIX domain-containing protein [Caldilineales bacterium]